MKKNKINVNKILLDSKNVNSYTKMIITLSILNFYEDYYIPNKKLMNQLKKDKKSIIRILNKLKKDGIINLWYEKNKRYFTFNIDNTEKEIIYKKKEIFNYDWLEEEE